MMERHIESGGIDGHNGKSPDQRGPNTGEVRNSYPTQIPEPEIFNRDARVEICENADEQDAEIPPQDPRSRSQSPPGYSLQDPAEMEKKKTRKRKKRKKTKKKGPPIQPSFERPLLVYPEATAVDVIRPCIVEAEEQYMQWFAFRRMKNGSLYLYAYAKIPGGLVDPSRDKAALSMGIPLIPQLVDAKAMTLRHDVFLDQDPSAYLTYTLNEIDYRQNDIYICRLFSSARLWEHAAESIWWKAVQMDALPAFEMLRLNREAWLQKTGSIQVAETKLGLFIRYVRQHLSESHFLDTVIREICALDEIDNVMDFKTSEAEIKIIEKQDANGDGCSDSSDPLGDRLSLEQRARFCGGSSILYYMGSDDADDAYRWGYEDWPRPRNIASGSIVPFGNTNYAAKIPGIGLVDGYYPESAVDRLLEGHSCESSEMLLSPGALFWREKLRSYVATGTRTKITLLSGPKNGAAVGDETMEGTVISVRDTFFAVQDGQTPPKLCFFSLNHVFP